MCKCLDLSKSGSLIQYPLVVEINDKIDNEISDEVTNEISGSENEIIEDLEVNLASIDGETSKPLKDLDESANLIDDYDDNEHENEVFIFRPQIDCDVLNSIIEEEVDEDIQSNVSSLVLDKLPNKEKVDFSVSTKIIPDPNYNGKETDVDDSDEDKENLYHSTLVTTCVDSDSDVHDNYDLEVPNESWTSFDRPQPVGCSSDRSGLPSTFTNFTKSFDSRLKIFGPFLNHFYPL